MLTITTTKDLSEIDFPMKIYDSVQIGTAVASEESLGTFTLYAGLSKEHVAHVKEYSLNKDDVDLQKNTSDFARFGEGDYEERYDKKERHSFSLVHDDTQTLASLIWFGPRDLPESVAIERSEDQKWDTVAFRTYGIFRGVGITSGFSAHVIDAYQKRFSDHKIWLAAPGEYKAAMGLYKKLGFQDTGEVDDGGKTIMILQ